MNQHDHLHTQSLQIQILEHTGKHQQLVWRWPANVQTEMSFADVLQTLPGIDNLTLGQASYCKITCTRSQDSLAWWLTNTGAEFTCTLNGQPLAPAQTVRLMQSDDIEFGLSHLRIVLTEALAHDSKLDGIDDLRASFAHDASQGAAYERIEPGLEAPVLSTSRESLQECAAGLSELAGNEMVINLLGKAGQGHDQHDLTRLLMQSSFSADSTLVPAEAEVRRQPVSGSETEMAALSDRCDPLDQLHQHYLERLRNPFQSADTAWQENHCNQQQGGEDAFSNLQSAAGFGGVHELLSGSESTQNLLASFDQVNDSNLLAPASFECVMHLFAPADLQTLAATQHAGSLPGLTRSEHHFLAIDSSMDELIISRDTDVVVKRGES
ncbi:TagK domain-containing protein [Undibacterium curvum]|uniref:TagK domain-containing protein n=1 Tax=Undibacterium curvum TaxID=2762294 RepID=A0ABR7A9Y8_9BURK|nr:TagK domain-containing protein [Undibacterium curvum]MBC3933686.1 TagK domain-containing protein [Undibacterium curvum]